MREWRVRKTDMSRSDTRARLKVKAEGEGKLERIRKIVNIKAKKVRKIDKNRPGFWHQTYPRPHRPPFSPSSKRKQNKIERLTKTKLNNHLFDVYLY